MVDYRFSANLDEIADKLNQKKDVISGRIKSEIERLSISTHAFVVKYAQEKLKGWQRSHFFGENNQNVRWTQVSDGMWVVEIDESVRWLEEGRDSVFMSWLLEGKSAKTAKDGSKYAVIPMTQSRGVGGKMENKNPGLASIIGKSLKKQGITLNRIERDESGAPKLGVLHRLNINEPKAGDPGFFQMSSPIKNKFFSQGRSAATAKQIGLKPSKGDYFLSNTVVTQREVKGSDGRTSIKKEAVTFRVISSKSEPEGRWFYPKVEPLDSLGNAFRYAEAEWEKILKQIEAEFTQQGE